MIKNDCPLSSDLLSFNNSALLWSLCFNRYFIYPEGSSGNANIILICFSLVIPVHSMDILFSPQVQDVTMEIQDLLQWLENTDLRLSSTRTVWGMPDSANERLNAHLVRLISLIIQYITISSSLDIINS